jgi:hypothetical protein
MSELAYKNWLQGCCLRGVGDDKFPLQKGSKGTQVIKLQVMLNTEGAGLNTDGDFGRNTLLALQKYYGKDSVVDQKDFDKLFLLQAKKGPRLQPKTVTVKVDNQTAQIPANSKDEFSSMLQVDYDTFTKLAQLGKVINTMVSRMSAHSVELKKQQAIPNYKGPYGLFKDKAAADKFGQDYLKLYTTWKRVKTNYEKRQAAYKNNPTLKAARLITEAKDAAMDKAKKLFASFKSWALGNTDDEGLGLVISGSVLLIAGAVVATAALVVMAALIVTNAKPTALDNADVTKANSDIDKSIASEEKDKAELYKQAEVRRAAGDVEGAKKFEEAALKKDGTISELKESKVEIIKSQQENDKINAEKGGILDQLGDNAGKIAIAAGGLLVVGLIWQNKDSFKAKSKKEEQEVLQEAA